MAVSLGPTGLTLDTDLLDDYEEGTCTISVKAWSSNPTSIPTFTARYTKIGNRVIVNGQVNSGLNTSGGSGQLYFDGLPFTAVGSTYSHAVLSFNGMANYATATDTPVGLVASDQKINMYSMGDETGWGDLVIIAGTNYGCGFTLTYETAS
jgi:hypothetical protein